MPSQPFSRRDFLKLSAMAALSIALPAKRAQGAPLPFAVGRVTTSLIYLYQQPSFSSERIGKRARDTLLNLLEEIQSASGPAYNPLWYRISDGFVHSGFIQKVDFRPPNTPVSNIPRTGLLAEVTVPYTRTFYRGSGEPWKPLYRLYYESTHWVKGISEMPDGKPWYRLSDPKNDTEYYVPAADLRPIQPEEYAPIARDVPAADKRIVVSIADQTLTAYEGEKVVMHTSIASGTPTLEPKEGEIPTDTPLGYFRITLKMPSRHMGNGAVTDEIEAYELPGVPWTLAFHETGAALHGTFWHNNFGRKMSHGCVNMRNAEALWLFRWTDPVYEPTDWYGKGLGTLIQVK